jgi:uncharacterized membrane protein
MMEWMGIFMLLGLLVLGAILAGAIYLGVRYGLGAGRREDDARATLDRRFAAGEIDADEYHERASALRSLEPAGRRRR